MAETYLLPVDHDPFRQDLDSLGRSLPEPDLVDKATTRLAEFAGPIAKKLSWWRHKYDEYMDPTEAFDPHFAPAFNFAARSQSIDALRPRGWEVGQRESTNVEDLSDPSDAKAHWRWGNVSQSPANGSMMKLEGAAPAAGVRGDLIPVDHDPWKAGDPRWLTPEDVRRRPTVPPDPWYVPPQEPRYTGELRNLAPRPSDALSSVAETLSPTMGGYSLGYMAGGAAKEASEGNYLSALAEAAPIALGMAPIPGLRRGAMPRGRPSAPEEMPKQAALRVDDQLFTGANHAIAQANAERALGKVRVDAAFNQKTGFGDNEGFVTTAGRYVTRKQAIDMLAAQDAVQILELPGYRSQLHSSQLRDAQKKQPALFADAEGELASAAANVPLLAAAVAPVRIGSLRGYRVEKMPKAGINGETFYDVLTDKGGLVARLKVHPDNSVGNIFVDTPNRRQGLASELYDYAARDLGVPKLGTGSFHTPEGEALRAAYDARRIPNPIKAYHGSPHDFDKFDLSRIGSGEGAQAYGHGLYFAEREGVARSYRDQLAGKVPLDTMLSDPANYAGHHLKFTRMGGRVPEDVARAQSLSMMASVIKDWEREAAGPAWKVWGRDERVADSLKLKRLKEARALLAERKENPEPQMGRIYEVALHARPEQFLDWDKPLSGQSEGVTVAIRQSGLNPHQSARPSTAEAISANRIGWDRQAFGDALAEQGIPGIRYLDQGSRNMPQRVAAQERHVAYLERKGAPEKEFSAARQHLDFLKSDGAASSNYVVWTPEIIEIIRKYGIAGIGLLPPAVQGALSERVVPVDHDPFLQ